jgi:hypothetical protein
MDRGWSAAGLGAHSSCGVLGRLDSYWQGTGSTRSTDLSGNKGSFFKVKRMNGLLGTRSFDKKVGGGTRFVSWFTPS